MKWFVVIELKSVPIKTNSMDKSELFYVGILLYQILLNMKLNIVLLQSIQLIEITIQKLIQGLLQILKEVMENAMQTSI